MLDELKYLDNCDRSGAERDADEEEEEEDAEEGGEVEEFDVSDSRHCCCTHRVWDRVAGSLL